MIGVVHGALTSFAIALVVLVAQSWPRDEFAGDDIEICACECFVDRDIVVDSACRADYAPVAPADGSWCGVRIDDRYPLTDESFPAIAVE